MPITDEDRERFHQIGLLALSQGMRMACNGSTDSMPIDEHDVVLAYLKERDRDWRPTTLAADREWDDAVRVLLRCAIRDGEQWSQYVHESAKGAKS